MKTAVDIYRLLPKTNCGACGLPSCMGYAAKLATYQASLDDCRSLTSGARETLKAALSVPGESHGTAFEQTLHALQLKVKDLDFAKTASRFGATLIDPNTLRILFLNDHYTVTKSGIMDARGSEPEASIAILIYNHLCMPEPPDPAHEWITFSSIPASHAKDKAWAGHVEQIIANYFEGKTPLLRTACERHGGRPARMTGTHDAAYTFDLFPHYPALLLFYDAVPDEDFPAQCKLLLDRTAPRYLDIESIVVLGEEFAKRLTTVLI